MGTADALFFKERGSKGDNAVSNYSL